MKTYKHNFILALLLCTSVVFGQKQTKKIKENFKVNKDVVVEINTQYSDITVAFWNKNQVSIEGEWEVEGMTKDEALVYFKKWDFEALGNKSKVIITSKSSGNNYEHQNVFDEMDFDFDFGDFDFESITHIGELFNGNFYSDFTNIPTAPLPLFPAPVLSNLHEIEFDNAAYQKDKEGYMKDFEKRQKEWKKKVEPQLKEYEEKMTAWEKENGLKIKEFEEKMEKWGEEFGEKFGKSMEEWGDKFGVSMEKWGDSLAQNFEMSDVKVIKLEQKAKKLEEKMGKEYAKKLKEKAKKYNISKRLVIKVPKETILKIDAKYGTISLPNSINVIK